MTLATETPGSPWAITARALRVLVGPTRQRPRREEAVLGLRRSLHAFIDHHPRADKCVLDAGSSYADFWTLTDNRFSAFDGSLQVNERAALQQAQVLIELQSDIDSVLLAVAVAYVSDNLEVVQSLLRNGEERFGLAGYEAHLGLWIALLHQVRGDMTRAVDTYRQSAMSPFAIVRRPALASGAFAAAAGSASHHLDWFLDRMAEEDARHQACVFERVKQLRQNRLGRPNVEEAMRQIRRRLGKGYTSSKWVSNLAP